MKKVNHETHEIHEKRLKITHLVNEQNVSKVINQSKEPLHHRRSIRLPGYDYMSEGGYFITCVTQGRACLFGEVNNGVMKLNNYGEIVKEEWFKTNFLRDNVELVDEEFVVMPNHIHGIIWIIEGGRGSGGRGTAPLASLGCA